MNELGPEGGLLADELSAAESDNRRTSRPLWLDGNPIVFWRVNRVASLCEIAFGKLSSGLALLSWCVAVSVVRRWWWGQWAWGCDKNAGSLALFEVALESLELLLARVDGLIRLDCRNEAAVLGRAAGWWRVRVGDCKPFPLPTALTAAIWPTLVERTQVHWMQSACKWLLSTGSGWVGGSCSWNVIFGLSISRLKAVCWFAFSCFALLLFRLLLRLGFRLVSELVFRPVVEIGSFTLTVSSLSSSVSFSVAAFDSGARFILDKQQQNLDWNAGKKNRHIHAKLSWSSLVFFLPFHIGVRHWPRDDEEDGGGCSAVQKLKFSIWTQTTILLDVARHRLNYCVQIGRCTAFSIASHTCATNQQVVTCPGGWRALSLKKDDFDDGKEE